MRMGSHGIIFKIMLMNGRQRVVQKHPNPGHPRITIPVGKIHVLLKKYLLRIPRECGQRQTGN